MIGAWAALSIIASSAPMDVATRAEAARAEALGFEALERREDCDAAHAFSRAFALAADERLLYNAALAWERAGDFDDARRAFAQLTDARLVAQASKRVATLADAVSRTRCAPVEVARPPPASVTTPPPVTSGAPAIGLRAWGVAAFAAGALVGGGAAALWAARDRGVLGDPRSSGGAKEAALSESSTLLVGGGSLAGLLLVAGGVLVPLSFAQEDG